MKRFSCALSLLVPSLALAQNQDPPQDPPAAERTVEPTPAEAPPPPPSEASEPARLQLPSATVPTTARGAFGVDLASQYFFRGILQENQGLIVQPWFRLGYHLYDGDEALHDLDLTFGSWNSIHDGPTGGANGNWYEADAYVELSGKSGERFAFTTRYTAYTSPNHFFENYERTRAGNPAIPRRGFRDVEEVSVTVRYDDRGQFGDGLASGLQPHATFAFELNGNRDLGRHQGGYGELGIAPWLALDTQRGAGWRLSFPCKLGVSLYDYYETQNAGGGSNEFFGYVDLAAAVSTPLSMLPRGMGPWLGEASLHWILLGNNLQERNTNDTGAVFFTVGASTTF